MKRASMMVVAILAVFLAIYNVLVFLLPLPITSAFWSAYGFTTIAFVLQIFFVIIGFGESDRKSAFIGLSILNVGFIYLILQGIWGMVVMIYLPITDLISTLVSFLLLGWCFLSVFTASNARDMIAETDKKSVHKQAFIQNNRAILEGLLKTPQNEELKKNIATLHDLVRFSDPVSNSAVGDQEAMISQSINELKALVNEGKEAEAAEAVKRISSLLTERNIQVKALK
jgi:hypothetical protein